MVTGKRKTTDHSPTEKNPKRRKRNEKPANVRLKASDVKTETNSPVIAEGIHIIEKNKLAPKSANHKKTEWKKWQKDRKKKKKSQAGQSGNVQTNTQTSAVKESSANKPANGPVIPDLVSSNWKKLQKEMKKTQTRSRHKKKTLIKKDTEEKLKSVENEPEIWFDDVDEALLTASSKASSRSSNRDGRAAKFVNKAKDAADGLVKENAYKGLTKAVALDCEMVGVGDQGKESVLARVSVVNQHGECLYDTFVRSREEVVDYRTRFSGVTPEKLHTGSNFLDVQKKVSDLIQGRILVGHAVHHDLKVLFLDHPRKDIRDTSRYKPYRELFKGRTPALKNLTSRLLGVKIQTGEHNSVTDAQATMRLYTLNRKEWEGRIVKKKRRGLPKDKKKKIVAPQK